MKVTIRAVATGTSKWFKAGRKRERLKHFMSLFFSLSLLIMVSENALAGQAGAKAEAAALRLFGAGIEVAKERKPYFLTGDFNGDRQEDLLVLIRLKGGKSALPKDVVVLNPWGYEEKDSQGKSNLALVIVHGTSAGWDTETPLGKYFLTDREYFSTPIWESAEQANLISLKKKGPRGRGATPRGAKGDAVSMATEAGIDIFLYWDGRAYKIYAPPEEP